MQKQELLAPRARDKGLVIRDLDDELLVYDIERKEAHCLDGAAAVVWRHCDGLTTISELARLVADELDVTAGEEIVWRALLDLSSNNLLQENVCRPAIPGMSRRRMLQKVGIAVAAGTVTSLAIGGVAHAVSCVGTGTSTCPGQQVCCGGVCCATGSCCSDNTCCSGTGNTCCGTPTTCCTTACCNAICCPSATPKCKQGVCST